MRISDWSSDVCSSDLPGCPHRRLRRLLARELPHGLTLGVSTLRPWASANFVGARHLFPCSVAARHDQGMARTLHAHLGARTEERRVENKFSVSRSLGCPSHLNKTINLA